MNQYFNQNTGKYHLTLEIEIPKHLPSRPVNFRIFSITNRLHEIIRDPKILNSNYVFEIYRYLFGKKVFFNFSFDKNEFENIRSINLGLCEENVSWIFKDIMVENVFFIENEKNNTLLLNKINHLNDKINNDQVKNDVTKDILNTSLELSSFKDFTDKESSVLEITSSIDSSKTINKKNTTDSIHSLKKTSSKKITKNK